MATTASHWYDPPDPNRNRKHKISEGATKADNDVAEETRKQKAILDDLILSAKRVRVKEEADRADDPLHYEYIDKRNVCYAKRCRTPTGFEDQSQSTLLKYTSQTARAEVAGRFEETGVRPDEIAHPLSGDEF